MTLPHEAKVDPDDWDHHWEAYGEGAQTNPANRCRRRLVMQLLGRPAAGSAVLDIKCGQGEFAIHLAQTYPDIAVWGVEHRASGVRRGAGRGSGRRGRRAVHRARFARTGRARSGAPAADLAVRFEVLEHVEDPARLMRNAAALLSPGVPGSDHRPRWPRSAFDWHIGHHRHFDAAGLTSVLTDADYRVERVLRAGFPFFNLDKLAVIAAASGSSPRSRTAHHSRSRPAPRRWPRGSSTPPSSTTATTRRSAGSSQQSPTYLPEA